MLGRQVPLVRDWVNGVEVYRSPEVPLGSLSWNTNVNLHESSNGQVPNYNPLRDVTYEDLKEYRFAEGSMGPKVIAACWFAEISGKPVLLLPLVLAHCVPALWPRLR